MAYENYNGLQKSPEPKVRDGGEIATGIGGAAATGASMGSTIGPWGTVIGAGVGAGVGAVAQFSGRNTEREQLKGVRQYNSFIDSLSGLSNEQAQITGVQAKRGLNNRYQSTAEVESIAGIGEIVLDKNKNVKYVSTGNKPHSEGGDPLPFTLKKGDSIIPTQGDAKAQERTLNLVKRFKLRGDKVAERELDSIISKLPTNEDYKEQELPQGKYFKGKQGDRPVGIDDPNSPLYIGNYYQPAPEREEISQNLSPTGFKKEGEVYTSNSLSYESSHVPSPVGTTYVGTGAYAGNVYKLNDETGEVGYQLKGTNGYTYPTSEKESNAIRANIFDRGPRSIVQQNLQPMQGKDLPQSTGISTQPIQDVGTRKLSTNAVLQDNYDKNPVDPNEIQNRNNPLKYLSAANNIYQSAQAPELTERRYYNPEEMQYKDMSAAQRAAITEQRNTAMGNMRGRGLSAGQAQSYATQIGAQALRANAQVNDREAQRYDAVNNANIQGSNQAKAMNTQMASRYDEIDAQNRATKQKYGDQGILDIANFAQADEQKRYTMDKDKRAFEIQDNATAFMGTGNYDIRKDANGNWEKVFIRTDQLGELAKTTDYEMKDGVPYLWGEAMIKDGDGWKLSSSQTKKAQTADNKEEVKNK